MEMAHRTQNRSLQKGDRQSSGEEVKQPRSVDGLNNNPAMSQDLSFLYELLPSQSLLTFQPSPSSLAALLANNPVSISSAPVQVAPAPPASTTPPPPLLPVTTLASSSASSASSPPTLSSLASNNPLAARHASLMPEEVQILSRHDNLASPCSRIFESQERFDHVLEASTSMMTPRGEDTVTYLNKAQFYAIHSSYCAADTGGELPALVRSEVYLVFREEKDAQSELGYWQYWHNQQANPNQRGLEIDQRSFRNVQEVDTIAYNAYSFKWNPAETAKVVVRVNCLSTEFSSQKGVKGIPLFLMIDTYEDVSASMESEPNHRCYCKVKVFRDKGAERKNKDESKSADRRMAKILKQQCARKRPRDGATGSSLSGGGDDQVSWEAPGTIPPAPPLPPALLSSAQCGGGDGAKPKQGASGFFQAPSKITHLTPTSTLSRKPVAFIPKGDAANLLFNNKAASELLMSEVRAGEKARTFKDVLSKAADGMDDLDMSGPPQVKTARLESEIPGLKLASPLTIYVRKDEEKVYNAVMLYTLTVQEVADNIGRRYGIGAAMIKGVYKHTKKGILVYMENRMVECFENEDDFVIRFEYDNPSVGIKLYLRY